VTAHDGRIVETIEGRARRYIITWIVSTIAQVHAYVALSIAKVTVPRHHHTSLLIELITLRTKSLLKLLVHGDLKLFLCVNNKLLILLNVAGVSS